MKNKALFIPAVLCLNFIYDDPTSNVNRHIHINGEHLSAQDIMLLDSIFSKRVENGSYWIDIKTGEWGLQGNAQKLGQVPLFAKFTNKPINNVKDESICIEAPKLDVSDKATNTQLLNTKNKSSPLHKHSEFELRTHSQ